jgi:enterochelin esterase family protein
MRRAITSAVGLACAGMAIMSLVRATVQQPSTPAPHPDSQYRLGPDSLPQEGVPKGEIRGPFTLPCQVYPGTQHTYCVYVPAQYDPKELSVGSDEADQLLVKDVGIVVRGRDHARGAE